MGKPDEDIVEKAFVVRSYGKGELASMYIDGVQQQTSSSTNGYVPRPDWSSSCRKRAWRLPHDGTRPHKCGSS